MGFSQIVRCSWLVVTCAVLSGPAPTAWAQVSDYCGSASEYPVDSNPANGHNPQNVILIVLDDTSVSEFPTFNAPVRWKNEDDPLADTTAIDEAGLRRPDLNRLAARVYARTTCCAGTLSSGDACLGPVEEPSSTDCSTPANLERVVPVDLENAGTAGAADDFRYSTGASDPEEHILRNFGGLAKLAREGVAYERHYAPSGRCAPTRASIFTGRSHIDVGVSDNGAALKVEHITVADFMKGQGYKTGLIGKWHMRNGDERSCWQRGFEETFHYEAPSRRHDKSTSLKCAPLREDDETPKYFCTLPGSGTCTSDADCGTDQACAPGWQAQGLLAGKCYDKTPTPCSIEACTTGVNCECANGNECQRWGSYLGAEPNTERYGCHPEDIDNPLCCTPKPVSKDGKLRADEYSFNKRINEQLEINGVPQFDNDNNPIAVKFWRTEGSGIDSTHPCYSNETSTFDLNGGGCRYDTRYYADAADNFIRRHKNEPFFLYVAIHGLHAPNSAPNRVEAHYKTDSLKSRAPASKDRFWAAMEEIDAAIGRIMETVTDPAVGISDKTLVLLTADQGRASSGFGEPVFKGGKGSISEGGIQVGLHAWGPGLGISTSGILDDGDAVKRGVSSHADLFATIAHASGCIPSNAKGQYTFSSCQDATRRVCTTNGDCDQPGATPDDPNDPPSACESNPDGANCTHCVERRIAGRTLLPKLSSLVRGYTTTSDRDVSFAQYIGSGYAIVARQGASALGLQPGEKIGICGVEKPVDAGAMPEDSPIDRMRRAGSTLRCTPGLVDDPQSTTDPYDQEGDGWCAEQVCTANGKFCVPTDFKDECAGSDVSSCDWTDYPRCRGPKDCAADRKCMQVKVPCDACFEAEFKLRGGGGDNAAEVQVKDLFDLRTNPEEIEDLNLVGSGDADITSVKSSLRSRLGGWWDCVRDHGELGEILDCENCLESTTLGEVCAPGSGN